MPSDHALRWKHGIFGLMERWRQERIVFGKRIRLVSEALPFDDAGDSANYAAQHSLQLLVRRG
jgi:hypothetical protein